MLVQTNSTEHTIMCRLHVCLFYHSYTFWASKTILFVTFTPYSKRMTLDMDFHTLEFLSSWLWYSRLILFDLKYTVSCLSVAIFFSFKVSPSPPAPTWSKEIIDCYGICVQHQCRNEKSKFCSMIQIEVLSMWNPPSGVGLRLP